MPPEPARTSEDAVDTALLAQVESLSTEAAQVQDDMRRLQAQSNAIQQELALQEAGRNQPALIVAMAEKDLNEARQSSAASNNGGSKSNRNSSKLARSLLTYSAMSSTLLASARSSHKSRRFPPRSAKPYRGRRSTFIYRAVT